MRIRVEKLSCCATVICHFDRNVRSRAYSSVLLMHVSSQINNYPQKNGCERTVKYLQRGAVGNLRQVPQDDVMRALHGMNHDLRGRRSPDQISHSVSHSSVQKHVCELLRGSRADLLRHVPVLLARAEEPVVAAEQIPLREVVSTGGGETNTRGESFISDAFNAKCHQWEGESLAALLVESADLLQCRQHLVGVILVWLFTLTTKTSEFRHPAML